VLIVDHRAPRLEQDDLAPLLQSENSSLRVIYLTLAENRMIVHNQQLVSNVTIDDLLQAVHQPAAARSGDEH
jgi:hypothetical protein